MKSRTARQLPRWFGVRHTGQINQTFLSMRHTEISNLYEEKHYTPGQIAKSWSLSEDSVRRLFKNEPGVLEIPRPETRHKRAYTTLRVPESVLRRVHARLTKKAA